MAIQSGIGVGEAQVYNTNGSLNTYARLMQQQQLTRQREQKELTDQLSKVKVDGIREADRNKFYEKYEKAKDTFRQTLNTKDKREKMYLQGEMDKQLLELNDFGSRSREYGKLHQEVSGKFLDDRFRDQFKDEAVKLWQESDKYSIEDARLVKDPSTLSRQVDGAAIDDRITKIDKTLLDTSVWSNPINEKGSEGNKAGVFSYNKREVPPEKQYQAYLNEYDSNRNFRKHLVDQYGDEPKEVLVKAYADERRQTGMLFEKSKPTFKENDNWKEKALFSDNLARQREKEKKKDVDEDGNFRYNWAKDMMEGKEGSGEQLKAIVKGTNGYKGDLKVQVIGSKLTFEVPAFERVTYNEYGEPRTVKYDKYRVTVDKADPDAIVTLNKLVSDVTRENVPVSKLLTTKKGANLPKPTNSTTTSKSNSVSSGKKYAGLDKDGNPIFK